MNRVSNCKSLFYSETIHHEIDKLKPFSFPVEQFVLLYFLAHYILAYLYFSTCIIL